jgi:hypothetical protein
LTKFEIDQVRDNDAGHSGGVGRSLLKRSDEERDHDCEDGSVDLETKVGEKSPLIFAETAAGEAMASTSLSV